MTLPAMPLSGLTLPTTLAPGRLDTLSRFAPLRHPVDAVRDAFAGRYATTPMLYGVLVAVGLAAPAVMVGTRAFRADRA
ncbi:hypothetical protein ACIQXD_28335 [Streptomyces uncialis]|uniref:hypothetical protein n=1 Tax=Streptomyces uncialis TaxID=1048205 RepID=UPI00380A9FC1